LANEVGASMFKDEATSVLLCCCLFHIVNRACYVL
jgi:hypothetical protein